MQHKDVRIRNDDVGARHEDVGMRTDDVGVRHEDMRMRTDDVGVQIYDLGMRTDEDPRVRQDDVVKNELTMEIPNKRYFNHNQINNQYEKISNPQNYYPVKNTRSNSKHVILNFVEYTLDLSGMLANSLIMHIVY